MHLECQNYIPSVSAVSLNIFNYHACDVVSHEKHLLRVLIFDILVFLSHETVGLACEWLTLQWAYYHYIDCGRLLEGDKSLVPMCG